MILMTDHLKNNDLIKFVNIPGTSSENILETLLNSDYKIKYNTESIWNGKDIKHLTFIEENKYLKDFLFYEANIPNNQMFQFTICRDPIERFKTNWEFISNYFKEQITILEDYDSFVHIMERQPMVVEYKDKQFSIIGLLEHPSNCFQPQFKFISPKAVYWKREDGFGKKFDEWFKKNNKVDYEIKTKSVKLESPKNNFSDKILDNVEKYYEKDKIVFNYK